MKKIYRRPALAVLGGALEQTKGRWGERHEAFGIFRLVPPN